MSQKTIGEIYAANPATVPLDGSEMLEIEQTTSKGVTVSGLRRQNVAAKSADFVIGDTGADVFEVTTGATNRTGTGPTLAANQGRVLTLRKADAGAGKLTFDPEGAEEIDGRTSIAVYSQGGVIVVRGGANEWEILAYHAGEPITNAKRITGEYLLDEDHELDYSASFTDGMAAATITFTQLPSDTVLIHVKYKFVDTGINPKVGFKRSSGGTFPFALGAQFADAGLNAIEDLAWLPTSGNTIRVTSVAADNTRTFCIIGYKTGE